jgi:TonB family protein
MKLAGDLAEFSLADFVQVSGVALRTCCVHVLTVAGNGKLYLQGGEVVHASYEDLGGFDAFVALVAATAGHFQVENGAVPEQRNLQGNVQKLLIDANRRIADGAVPRPTRQAGTATAAAVAPTTGAREMRRAPWIAAAALLLLAAVGWLAFARHDTATGGASTAGADGAAAVGTAPPGTAPAVETTRLTGPRDAKPVLVSGQPPAAPDPGSPLKPTIVCRLLIDPDGQVAEAKVYRSRLDLASFEDAALDAVRRYRFTPGRLNGAPVAVWINWPVSFR